MVLQSFRTPRPTSNPYLTLLLRNLPTGTADGVRAVTFSWPRALLGRYDVLHLHWPELLLRSRTRRGRLVRAVATAALWARVRRRRTPVVRTVHNPTPHEPGGAVERLLLRRLDAVTTTTVHLTGRTVGTTCPRSAPVVVPHGHYRDWYAGRPGSPKVPGRVVHPGLLRAYKGVDDLLAAFEALPGERSLHVAGAPADAALAGRVRAAAARDRRVLADLRHLDDDGLVRAVTAAELVVLPYPARGGSGAQLLALSLDRPVLLPAGPAAAELAAEVGPGWVHTFTGPLRADDLERALTAVRDDPPAGRPDLSGRDWDVVGRAHADLYRALAGRRTGRRGTPVPV